MKTSPWPLSPGMNRSINLISIVFVFIVCSVNVAAQSLNEVSPEQVGMSAERLARLDGLLDDHIEQAKIAGAVALIARRGKIAYFESFGWRDKEIKSKMKKDALFRIASQTKAITSVGIMILQERGKLFIGEPLWKYLPEYEHTTVAEIDTNGDYQVVAAKRGITIRDLLMHTAGIDYGMGPAMEEWKEAGIQGWYFANRKEPIRQTIAKMAKLPQNAQPGEKFVYGYSTDILGAVIEVVSGKPLNTFFTEEIFAPLGMTDTHFYVPRSKRERLATVYTVIEEGIVRSPSPGSFEGINYIGQGHYVDGPRKSYSGGAGLVSSTHDYALFLQMLLNRGELNGTRILSRKSVELMIVDHLGSIPFPVPGIGFGLGFAVVNSVGEWGQMGSIGSYSWGGAYRSSYWVDPVEELVIVYHTQLLPAANREFVDKFRALVYQAIID